MASTLALLASFTACSNKTEPADPHQGGSAGAAGSAGGAGRAGSEHGGAGGSDRGGSGGTGGTTAGSGGDGGATDFDASDIQLNDVSVLFPLPKDAAELEAGLLDLRSEGARGVLLPETIYVEVGLIAGSTDLSNGAIGGDLLALYKDLRVVALRIDPCFASLEPPLDGKGCDNQLRLVVQEASIGGAADSALHLFYSITRAEVLELTRTIAGLRQSLAPGRRLGRLQPHPLMVEQGLAGTMGNGVRAAILAHAGEQNLVRVTRMTSVQGPFWDFSGFDIKEGHTVAMRIPTLSEGGEAVQNFAHGFGPISEAVLSPSSVSPDDVARLLDAEKAKVLSVTERAAALSKLVRLQNPNKHSPDTVDCVSCHITTPITKLVLEDIGWSTDGADDAYVADAQLFSAAELEPTFENVEPLTNVHAFSYGPQSFEGNPGAGINQRVVNESAAVVSYLLQQDFSGK